MTVYYNRQHFCVEARNNPHPYYVIIVYLDHLDITAHIDHPLVMKVLLIACVSFIIRTINAQHNYNTRVL